MSQRKKLNTHRLWGKHPVMYKNVWTILASGTQSELEAEKRIRGSDAKWDFKMLPLVDVPSDLM